MKIWKVVTFFENLKYTFPPPFSVKIQNVVAAWFFAQNTYLGYKKLPPDPKEPIYDKLSVFHEKSAIYGHFKGSVVEKQTNSSKIMVFRPILAISIWKDI